jgi:DNA-directed RNA polymerase subunit RPC12/RpoP
VTTARTTYVCLTCGYGIRVANLPLPLCPMCRTERWLAQRKEKLNVR